MSFHEDGCGYFSEEERTHNGQTKFILVLTLFISFSLVELSTSIFQLVFYDKLHPVITLIPVVCCILSTIFLGLMKKLYKEAVRHLYYKEELAYFSDARATFCICCAMLTPMVCMVMSLISCIQYPTLRTYGNPATVILFVGFIVNTKIAFHFDPD